MKAVTHAARTGRVSVIDAPDPLVHRGAVLIANRRSVISTGTERALLALGRKSLAGKARERPDQVRRVLTHLRRDGWLETSRRVRDRLDETLPLGYSSSGVVLAVGEGVEGVRPGDPVASNAPHATVACVPRHLCAVLPQGVTHEAGAFGVLGAIALNGVRLARVALGETVFVVGLGLVGQLAVALGRASGCRVIATDTDPSRTELASRMGADRAAVGVTATDVLERTRGLGADAVLVAAASEDSAPVRLAAEAVRAKGRIIVVGAVGLELDRRPLYAKEAEVVVACSYGPGRYDPEYEERGHDYPAAHVRWTENRNLEAVLAEMAAGRLDVAPLVTHRFPVAQAREAYALVDDVDSGALAIVLDYPAEDQAPARPARGRAVPADGEIGAAVVGCGSHARHEILPRLRRAPYRPVVALSARGLSAEDARRDHGFAHVASREEELLERDDVDVVFVLTRHDRHADLAARALRAGKHVFVEKPLALSEHELWSLEEAVAGAPERLILAGFNRRFAPATAAVKEHFAGVETPLTVTVRFNAGSLPPAHWTHDPAEGGGRLLGEACHAVDLATHLIGARPVRVHAESIGGPAAPTVTGDHVCLVLRHEDGSLSQVAYFAGGDGAMPKERVEVFGGGRSAVLDDYRAVELWHDGRRTVKRWRRRDKGHGPMLRAWGRALEQGRSSPIPWEELLAVSLATLRATRSLREGVPLAVDRPQPGRGATRD